MTRFAPLLLALALVACDSEASLTNANSHAPPVQLTADKASDTPYMVTEKVGVRTSGDMVLFHINGETIEMSAGEAYLIGEALTRVGYDTFPESIQGKMAPVGGRRCQEPSPGDAVTSVGGKLFKRCPPPPPPPFLDLPLLDTILDGAVEVMEAPQKVRWERIPGGHVAEY